MNPQVNLLYVAETGHVLAAFTRSAEPSQIGKIPDVFVGAGLPIRGWGDPATPGFENMRFVVPADKLKLLQVPADQDPRILLQPRTFYVDNTTKLQPFTNSASNVIAITSASITITGVTLSPPQPNLVILIQPAGGGETQYNSQLLPLTGASITVTLSSGDKALVLVPTYPPVFG